jgi:hypothetical protein
LVLLDRSDNLQLVYTLILSAVMVMVDVAVSIELLLLVEIRSGSGLRIIRVRY